ncbi:MAG: hypothetical protein BMS9Abin12_1509 [Acidimicrobiia bacterium]|nr:MAG: hypothetical protein BMS9Abin12_1509 [Acidimicrobiia bacterium]
MGIGEIVALLALGLFAGTLAATLGVGGGIIFVPVLVAVLGFSQLAAQGTSLAIILPTALIGTVIHARAGRVVWKVALVTGGVGIVAALIGARLALSMNEELLKKVFAAVLAVLAIRMAHRAWRLRRDLDSIDRGGDATGR